MAGDQAGDSFAMCDFSCRRSTGWVHNGSNAVKSPRQNLLFLGAVLVLLSLFPPCPGAAASQATRRGFCLGFVCVSVQGTRQ